MYYKSAKVSGNCRYARRLAAVPAFLRALFVMLLSAALPLAPLTAQTPQTPPEADALQADRQETREVEITRRSRALDHAARTLEDPDGAALRELDLYLAQSLARRGSNITNGLLATEVQDIGLSLRGSSTLDKAGSDSTQFFLLDDNRPVVVTQQRAEGLDTSFLGVDGRLRSLDDTGLYGTDSTVGFAIGSEVRTDGSVDRGFEVTVRSQFQQTLDTARQSLARTGTVDSALADRQYDVGVQVGYSGFNLDAHVIRRDSALDGGALGLEAGLSYQGRVFAARLSASEYRSGRDLVGVENAARRLISFKLEAALRLTDSLGLTGGVRYSDYGERWLVNVGENESQMVFIGGRFSF